MQLGDQRAAIEAQHMAPGSTVLEVGYCYSLALNTCLYYRGVEAPKARMFATTDILTNRALASHATTATGQVLGESLQVYRKRRDDLLNGCAG